MRTIRLADVARIVSGATPRTDQPNNYNGHIPWVTPKDLSGLNEPDLWYSSTKITDLGYQSCSTEMLPTGSVLFSSRAPIGLVAIAQIPVCTNQGFKSVVPGPHLDSRFLYWQLRSLTPYIAARGNGSTFKEVAKPAMEDLKIQVPPLEEQKRIAAILDKADAIRRKREQAIQLADEFLRSLFLDMFGDPVRKPKGWPVLPLRDVALKFSDGPFGSNLKSEHYVEHGVRVVRLQNIGVGRFNDDDKVFVSEQHAKTISRHLCDAGDLLIGTLGSPNLRACVLPQEIKSAINKADCLRLQVDIRIADTTYVCALLNSPRTLSLCSNSIHGQTRARISYGQLRNLPLPFPPIVFQKEFSNRLKQLDGVVRKASAELASVNDLTRALTTRAFRGEL